MDMDIAAVFFVFFVANSFSETTLLQCPGTDSISNTIVYCKVEKGNDLCLVCPVNLSDTKTITWTRNHRNIIIDGHNLMPDEDFLQDKCHNELSSIQVQNVTFQDLNDVYRCKTAQLENTTYILKILANPSLSIVKVSNNATKKELVYLSCTAEDIVEPLNLTWLLNENIESSELFNNTGQQRITSTYNYTYNIPKDTVECVISGPYIKPVGVVYVHKVQHENDRSFLKVIAVIIPVACILVGAFITRKQYNIKQRRLQQYNERVNTSQATHPVPPRNAYTVQPDVVQLSSETPSIEAEVNLKICLKVGKKFKYWKCTFSNQVNGKKDIFLKTLSNDSTFNEAKEFRQLATSLQTLPKHLSIVDLLFVSDESVPSVHYEFLAYGTLRDLLMTHYQEGRKSQIFLNRMTRLTANMSNQVEVLLSFSYEVAGAMTFLSSQKFAHPVLTTGKILLTEHGHCKLYAICPESMALSIVKEKLDKEYPPIMWMPPEAVFLKQYSVDSDVWNYGTFLWEMFSLGKMPYAGLNKQQLEEKVRQTIVLDQPLSCPGAVYSLMLSCWNISSDDRPKMAITRENVGRLLDHFTNDEQTEQYRATAYYDTLEEY